MSDGCIEIKAKRIEFRDGYYFDTEAGVERLLFPHPLLRITNTDTTTDLTSTVLQPFDELFGVIQIDDRPTMTTVNLATAEITVNEDGRYELYGAFAYDETAGNNARVNIAISILVNGTQVSPNFQGNYMRDASGHNEVSQEFGMTFDLSAGDTIQIQRDQVSGPAGNAALQGTNNFVELKRVQ